MELIRKNDDTSLKILEHSMENGQVLPLLHFENLEATGIVKHCFTTRLGGVSQGVCATLNLSFTRGDDEKAVCENFRRVAEVLDAKIEDFVFSDQTHTTNIRVVNRDDAGKGIVKPRDYTDVDGLVTNVPGLVLSTFFADCVPLYFVDPVHKAIGMTHSGWRGTVGRIGARTLQVMHEAYGTEAKDVICAIGPSICQECYEVSADVAKAFADEFQGHETEVVCLQRDYKEGNITDKELLQKIDPASEEKYQLNLWQANKIVMEESGVLPENIAVTNICTCCNPDELFSHRASQGKRGNLAGLLCLK